MFKLLVSIIEMINRMYERFVKIKVYTSRHSLHCILSTSMLVAHDVLVSLSICSCSMKEVKSTLGVTFVNDLDGLDTQVERF